MQRKQRRRPVHYHVTSFRDGAVMACLPVRKPSPKRIKEDGIRVDPDLVTDEGYYAVSQFPGWPEEIRIRNCDLLANRMNVRRAIRDLVIPELAKIESAMLKLNERLDRLAESIARSDRQSAH